MAENALFHRRHCCCRAFGHVAVAELAGNAHAAFLNGAGMDGMGEINRLRRGVAQPERRVGKPGYKDYGYQEPNDAGDDQTYNGQWDDICAWPHRRQNLPIS